MFKKIALASAVSLMLAAATVQAADAPKAAQNSELAVGVINYALIMNDIPQAKKARESLSKEFGPRVQELQSIENEGKKLQGTLATLQGDKLIEAQRKIAQLQSDYQLKGQALQEDQRKRMQEEDIKLGKMVQKVIDTIAKERGLKLVLRGDGGIAAYVDPSVDLTSEVITRVSKEK